jgi:hypothetical protein
LNADRPRPVNSIVGPHTLNLMRRIIITIAISLVALIVVAASVLAFGFFCSPPAIEITGDAHKKDFATHFLGEYCDSLSNVTLTDATSNAIVWSVETKPDVAFCYFSLSPGENPAFIERVSRVIVPTNQKTFTLTPQTKYKITVRRSGSTTRCGVATKTFAF